MNVRFEYFNSKNEIKRNEKSYISTVHSGIKSKNELLNYLNKILDLPGYFGKNWDALYECLTDFHWVRKKEIIIIHEDLPLTLENEKRTYLEILNDAQNNWREGEEHRLLIYFPKSYANKIDELLKL